MHLPKWLHTPLKAFPPPFWPNCIPVVWPTISISPFDVNLYARSELSPPTPIASSTIKLKPEGELVAEPYHNNAKLFVIVII